MFCGAVWFPGLSQSTQQIWIVSRRSGLNLCLMVHLGVSVCVYMAVCWLLCLCEQLCFFAIACSCGSVLCKHSFSPSCSGMRDSRVPKIWLSSCSVMMDSFSIGSWYAYRYRESRMLRAQNVTAMQPNTTFLTCYIKTSFRSTKTWIKCEPWRWKTLGIFQM